MTMMNLQSNLTGQGLADFAEGRIGTPYFYGAKISHGILTEEFVQELHEKLPDLVTDDYVERARQQGQVGKVNTDCSGLIGAYLGVELSSAQMYAVADQRIVYETYAWLPGNQGMWVFFLVNVMARIVVWKQKESIMEPSAQM